MRGSLTVWETDNGNLRLSYFLVLYCVFQFVLGSKTNSGEVRVLLYAADSPPSVRTSGPVER